VTVTHQAHEPILIDIIGHDDASAADQQDLEPDAAGRGRVGAGNELDETRAWGGSLLALKVFLAQLPGPRGQGSRRHSALLRQTLERQAQALTPAEQLHHLFASVHARDRHVRAAGVQAGVA